MAGCVECQKERMRQEKGLAVGFHLEESGKGGGRGAGTDRQCADTHLYISCVNLALLLQGDVRIFA